MNGGESVCWTKKPVPLSRKSVAQEKTIETTSSKKKKQYCQKCSLEGIKSPLQLFQLNEEESLLMCKNVECTFMPSSNWESLVVRRNISAIPRSSSSAFRNSTGSSRSSAVSVSSAPAHLNSSRGQVSGGWSQSSTGRPPASSHGRHVASPTAEVANQERKTLVPVAPFLCGHAHSFASFYEAKKIEDHHRLQQLKSLPNTPLPRTQPGNFSSFAGTPRLSSSSLSFSSLKRKGSSLDSDSRSGSSDSSLNSRPTSPDSSASKELKQRKLRRVIVPPETLKKIADGSLKVKIVNNGDKDSQVVIEKTDKEKEKRTEQLHSEQFFKPIASHASDINSSERSSQLTQPAFRTELNSVQEPETTSPKDNIQSHISAINSHLEALSKALGHDTIKPYSEILSQLQFQQRSADPAGQHPPLSTNKPETTELKDTSSCSSFPPEESFVDDIDLGLDDYEECISGGLNQEDADEFCAEKFMDE